jgi:HEAT repeats
MDSPVQNPGQTPQTAPPQAVVADPRLQPTPDYGSLGPGSDAAPAKLSHSAGALRTVAAITAGMVCAAPFLFYGNVHAAWEQLEAYLSLHGKPEPASPAVLSQHEVEKLDSMSAQMQAELLLERSINHYDGANDEIAARVDKWRLRRIKMTPHLTSLSTAAFNSNDLRVRAAAVEIELASLNVAKVPGNIDVFEKQAESTDKSYRDWGLWTLGLLGNRAIEQGRVTEILMHHLDDADEDSRHWAVESLALVGSDEAIAPLLKTFHNDPSPMVRERAACSLAQSGMFTEAQRRSIIPTLLDFAEDASLDEQTHTWVYQALRDITAQNLPNQPSAWRNWYGSSGLQG